MHGMDCVCASHKKGTWYVTVWCRRADAQQQREQMCYMQKVLIHVATDLSQQNLGKTLGQDFRELLPVRLDNIGPHRTTIWQYKARSYICIGSTEIRKGTGNLSTHLHRNAKLYFRPFFWGGKQSSLLCHITSCFSECPLSIKKGLPGGRSVSSEPLWRHERSCDGCIAPRTQMPGVQDALMKASPEE